MDRDIDYVLAVASSRSISKAAEVLCISQPSLSNYIQKLENCLGLQLFNRTLTGITLTEAGEVYVSHAREIKEKYESLSLAMADLKNGLSKKTIYIGMTLNSVSMYINSIASLFEKNNPGMKLEVINSMSSNLEKYLFEKNLNFVLGPDCCDRKKCTYKKLVDHHLLLAVPTEYNLEGYTKKIEGLPFRWIDICKLSHLNFVFQDKSCDIRHRIDSFLSSRGIELVPKQEYTCTALVVRATEQQTGCSFLSESFLDCVTSPESLRLYCVEREGESFLNTGISYRKGKILSDAENDLIRMLTKQLKENQKANRNKFSL